MDAKQRVVESWDGKYCTTWWMKNMNINEIDRVIYFSLFPLLMKKLKSFVRPPRQTRRLKWTSPFGELSNKGFHLSLASFDMHVPRILGLFQNIYHSKSTSVRKMSNVIDYSSPASELRVNVLVLRKCDKSITEQINYVLLCSIWSWGKLRWEQYLPLMGCGVHFWKPWRYVKRAQLNKANNGQRVCTICSRLGSWSTNHTTIECVSAFRKTKQSDSLSSPLARTIQEKMNASFQAHFKT